jgi:predicted alpha/beta-fold hydrolase
MHHFRAPRWLPGGNLQTIWPARLAPRPGGPPPAYRRERWASPDGDFIDVDHLPAASPARAVGDAVVSVADTPVETPADSADATAAPTLVLFHGLEGSSASHYSLGFAAVAQRLGWPYAVPHFRGCSGEINRAPRAYHSGDFEEIGWILRRMREASPRPLFVVGISLGGNALLRWAEEAGDSAAAVAAAVAAVSSPVDLAASGRAIDRGFNRLVYTRMFLSTMKPRALAKWQQFPGLFDRERVAAARTLHAFDNAFTAPLHGFKDTDDYWARASAKPHLQRIRIPALVVNARNDPFVPGASLPSAKEVGRFVTLWQPPHGGHVGFPQGPFPGRWRALPEAVVGWMRQASA